MSEIPFWVHDRPKWVSGITKSTTCQDVLHALVLAERKGSSGNKVEPGSKKTGGSKDLEVQAKEYSKALALVEQWRGVERPLSNSSRILKLWLAWGEERSQVRFVVKRISQSTTGNSTSTLPKKESRRPRRRNSRANSINSDTKIKDTVMHPSVLSKSSDKDLEKLMRIILTQGETIHWQLKKLQEREGQIESIEQEVHDSRTKTDKDYLLNAYLKSPTKDNLGATTDSLQEVLEALTQVFKINEQIAQAEEQADQLTVQLSPGESHPEMVTIQSELKDLRCSNDQAGREIDQNRHLISSMRVAYDERKALMDQLEKDVDTIELEGQRLQQELQALQTKRQEQTFEILSQIPLNNDQDISEDELEDPIIFGGGLLDDKNTGHYQILTNEQLYSNAGAGAKNEPSTIYDELQRRLRIKTSYDHDLRASLPSPDAHRIKATGSPGSNSSSGNSSGSSVSYEKSVRFSDRQLILSTPELPDLPPNPQYKKSILKGIEPGTSNREVVGSTNQNGDNTDSNSDTGLSSLHSSSDEGTYVLDTLVWFFMNENYYKCKTQNYYYKENIWIMECAVYKLRSHKDFLGVKLHR